jgi:hypothetical protein
MARLLTQILGVMSGSVGDIVFRRGGGRSYVSAHPSEYTSRTDAASRRNPSKENLPLQRPPPDRLP